MQSPTNELEKTIPKTLTIRKFTQVKDESSWMAIGNLAHWNYVFIRVHAPSGWPWQLIPAPRLMDLIKISYFLSLGPSDPIKVRRKQRRLRPSSPNLHMEWTPLFTTQSTLIEFLILTLGRVCPPTYIRTTQWCGKLAIFSFSMCQLVERNSRLASRRRICFALIQPNCFWRSANFEPKIAFSD
jgi:hypothetical protein